MTDIRSSYRVVVSVKKKNSKVFSGCVEFKRCCHRYCTYDASGVGGESLVSFQIHAQEMLTLAIAGAGHHQVDLSVAQGEIERATVSLTHHHTTIPISTGFILGRQVQFMT